MCEFPSFLGRFGKANYFSQELLMGCLQKDSKHSVSNTCILMLHQQSLNKSSQQKLRIKVCALSLSHCFAASLTHTLPAKSVLHFLTPQYSSFFQMFRLKKLHIHCNLYTVHMYVLFQEICPSHGRFLSLDPSPYFPKKNPAFEDMNFCYSDDTLIMNTWYLLYFVHFLVIIECALVLLTRVFDVCTLTKCYTYNTIHKKSLYSLVIEKTCTQICQVFTVGVSLL